MKKSKFLILYVFILSSIVACGQNQAYYLDKPITSTQSYEVKITDVTETESKADAWESAQESFDKINVGWNLGNSLECFNVDSNQISKQSLESSWGITPTTKETIDAVASQ